MRCVFPVLVSLLLISLQSLASTVEFSLDGGDFTYTAPLGERSVFVVDNDSGAIQITPTDEPYVRMSGKYRGDRPAKLRFIEVEPGKVKIVIDYPEENDGSGISGLRIDGRGVVISGSIRNIEGRHADLKVEIPRQLLGSVRAKSKRGDVSVSGFDDPLSSEGRKIILDSKQGSVRVERMLAPAGIEATTSQGEVISTCSTACSFFLKTNQGDIIARNNAGNIEAKTSMGNVQISGQRGRVEARTSMGNIRLDNPNATSETAKSSMGKVTGLRDSKSTHSVRECQNAANSDEFDF